MYCTQGIFWLIGEPERQRLEKENTLDAISEPVS
jgi:hypothetical protein